MKKKQQSVVAIHKKIMKPLGELGPCQSILKLPSYTDNTVEVHDCQPLCVQLSECLLLCEWSLVFAEAPLPVDWTDWDGDVGQCHPCNPWKSHTLAPPAFSKIQPRWEGLPGHTVLIGYPSFTKLCWWVCLGGSVVCRLQSAFQWLEPALTGLKTSLAGCAPQCLENLVKTRWNLSWRRSSAPLFSQIPIFLSSASVLPPDPPLFPSFFVGRGRTPDPPLHCVQIQL